VEEIVTYDGPWVEKGVIRVSDKPGIGVDINEEAQLRHPKHALLRLRPDAHGPDRPWRDQRRGQRLDGAVVLVEKRAQTSVAPHETRDPRGHTMFGP